MQKTLRENEQEFVFSEMGMSKDPSVRMIGMMHEVLDLLKDRERHGLPYEGGSLQQPRNWKRKIDVGLDAQDQARREIEHEEEERRKQDEAARELENAEGG